MKGYYLVLIGVCVGSGWPSLVAGQAFQNLDFETVQFSEVPNPTNPYDALATLPGWTFHHRDVNALHLVPHLGGNPQTVLRTDLFGHASLLPGISPAQGHYSIFLQEGINSPDLTQIGPAVSQTGLIPADAKSVRFYGGDLNLGGAESLWIVSINDVPTPVKRFVIGTWQNLPGEWPIYSPMVSADVSAFAGAVATLKFALDPLHYDPTGTIHLGDQTSGLLDDIRFSTLDYMIVPEPAGVVLALVWLGLAAVTRRRAV